MNSKFKTGIVASQAGDILQVSTKLSFDDRFGGLKVRLSMNRDDYKVKPGIYAVGIPNETSDVFVSANYKLSFDILRKNLKGLNAWILVLNTKGINVWCAAGKGTFGTNELVNTINVVSLNTIINHKRIILPQLGAVGVAAHKVKAQTGFNVVYGPVKASDIKLFVNSNYKATKEMRTVTFNLKDRLKLIPVDFLYGRMYLLLAFFILIIISGLLRNGISLVDAIDNGINSILLLFLAYISGTVVTPILLPYIPARSFALKGLVTGIVLFDILLLLNKVGTNKFEIISWLFIFSAVSSFLTMNFTGSSTYTSLSGVKKEMKIALPLQIISAVIGLTLFVLSKIY